MARRFVRVRFELHLHASSSTPHPSPPKERVKVRVLTGDEADRVLESPVYTFGWSDGWSATVTAREMKLGEKPPKVQDFAGYDWMIDSIIRHGEIRQSA